MTIDANHFTKVAEEGVDLDVGELLLGHVLDINGEAPCVVDHVGLLLGLASWSASSWSTSSHAAPGLRVHGHVRRLLLVKV